MCYKCLSSNIEVVQIFNTGFEDLRQTINIKNYQEGRFICRKCLGDPV